MHVKTAHYLYTDTEFTREHTRFLFLIGLMSGATESGGSGV